MFRALARKIHRPLAVKTGDARPAALTTAQVGSRGLLGLRELKGEFLLLDHGGDGLHALKLLQPRLGHLGLAGLVPKAIHEGLQMGTVLLLGGVLPLL